MNKDRLVILDGSSLMYRAFFAMPDLTNSEGLHTNAIYGFINMVFKIKKEFHAEYIVATFDRKAPTFRHLQYDEYKAGRKKMPQELAQQIPYLKEFLKLYGIKLFEMDGFEADDLIGTLSVFAEKNGMEVFVVTGDRDALQLATDNVKIVINKKGITDTIVYDRQKIEDELGVTPKEFIDVKGLMGDKSDNIKGVPGIGEKTAYKLIQEYKSVENVLENIDNLKGNKLKENLREYSEQAIFSKKLATIETEVPVELEEGDIRPKDKKDLEGIQKLFAQLQFKTLFSKIPEESNNDIVNTETEISKIATEKEQVEKKQCKVVKINSGEELKSVNLCSDKPLYILYKANEYSVLSQLKLITLTMRQEDVVYDINMEFIDGNVVTKFLQGMKKCKNIIIHSAKVFYNFMRLNSVEPEPVVFDTEIAAYLIDPGKKDYEIKTLTESLCHMVLQSDNSTDVILYMEDVEERLKQHIKDLDMNELLYNVELPLTLVISSMECEGFRVDREVLNSLGQRFSSEITETATTIYHMAGEEFNINSPKQLGKILFEKLDLPVIKKTKTGYSTNAEVLEALQGEHEIIDKIIYFRQLSKLYSTYVEGLSAVVDQDDKIHSNFNQTITTTGRLSSTEPNLQNIPVKYEMGREIRKVFIPEKDSVILSADYSQIELRVLAHISKDENMINAYKNHEDIHALTASEAFKIPMEEVTKEMRNNAKAVNFGIVYGIGDFSLAKELKISRKEAKQYIEAYLNRYPSVKAYLNDIVLQCKENGYVTTVLNRRRNIPEINSSKKMIVALGERLAMNTPIQGSAADIIKIAMIKVFKRLKELKLNSKLILQVHDELILNVLNDELDIVIKLIKKEMEEAISMSVPMEVDVNMGKNWYETK